MRLQVVDAEYRDIQPNRYNLVVASSGYEPRSRYLYKRIFKDYGPIQARKMVFAFDDYSDHIERRKNDVFFTRQGFRFVREEAGRYGVLARLLFEIAEQESDTLRVLIDYTTMRREMYAEILQFARGLSNRKTVEFTFAYSVGASRGRVKPKIVHDYIVLPGYEGVVSNRREKAAIYNLGFEPIVLQSIHEWIEPAVSSAFYADPGVSAGSGRFCLDVNQQFLAAADVKTFPVSLYSVAGYCRTFAEYAKSINRDFDIVVCSVGPKPLTFGALLSSSEAVPVTHIHARGVQAEAVGPQPTGQIVVTIVSTVE